MHPKSHARTILFLSNGYGEDTVGARIAQSVQALAGSRLRPVAFPIVGAGDPYRLVGIPVIGPRAHLPSGGFGYLNIRNAVKDVLAGSVGMALRDRKSTRLNSSHVKISYAVFCLKKKNKTVAINHLANIYSHRMP